MGYPYNFEPLNFVRGAMSLICSSFAVFELLSFRKSFERLDTSGEDDQDDETSLAMEYWIQSCYAIVALYLVMMFIRWYVPTAPAACVLACMSALVRIVQLGCWIR